MVLGCLLWLEWEKGARKGKLEHAHPGVCRITVCRRWGGMLPRCRSNLGRYCGTTMVTARNFGPCHQLSHLPVLPAQHRLRHKPREHLARDEAPVLFSPDDALLQGSINLATVAAD